MFKIDNIRLGHACNSSSSHSLMIKKGERPVHDDTNGYEFGWDFFTVASEHTKSVYMWHALFGALEGKIGADAARLVLAELTGYNVTLQKSEWGIQPTDGGYVDHQSTWGVPMAFGGEHVSVDFLKAFADMVKRDDVYINGGNDNDGYYDDERGTHFINPLENYGTLTVRWDPKGFWTLFNMRTGAKLRLRLDPTGVTPLKEYDRDYVQLPEVHERATFPELVDIKITDHCTIGCPFCYQDSTPVGEHASLNYIISLARALRNGEVFEVALGGGEPTDHPKLSSIIRIFSDEGIVPNITTRRPEWFLSHLEAYERLGAMAVSVDGVEGARRALRTFKQFPQGSYDNPTVKTLQVIDRVVDARALRGIMEAISEAQTYTGVTILGYKEVGRGGDYALRVPRKSDWISVWEDHPWRIRIDTAIARQYADEIAASKVEESSYHSSEGAWSCYVDAVAKTIAPSSYSTEPAMSFEDPSFLKAKFAELNVEFG